MPKRQWSVLIGQQRRTGLHRDIYNACNSSLAVERYGMRRRHKPTVKMTLDRNPTDFPDFFFFLNKERKENKAVVWMGEEKYTLKSWKKKCFAFFRAIVGWAKFQLPVKTSHFFIFRVSFSLKQNRRWTCLKLVLIYFEQWLFFSLINPETNNFVVYQSQEPKVKFWLQNRS